MHPASYVFSSGLLQRPLSPSHFCAMFQSPSRSTPATRLPREAAGLLFHSGGPISLSSPRENPAEPITLAVYSDPSFFSVSFRPFRNCADPSPMIATKLAPFVGCAAPPCNSCANATSASCIFPESSCRNRRRFTPSLHIKLFDVAWGPPLANIRPICAFHAHTRIRTSGLSLQPGALPGKGAAATLDDADVFNTGKSTRFGTV